LFSSFIEIPIMAPLRSFLYKKKKTFHFALLFSLHDCLLTPSSATLFLSFSLSSSYLLPPFLPRLFIAPVSPISHRCPTKAPSAT
jgi:hypothetical protein